MSRKQTIIILHYKYTVFRRRDRVQAPAPPPSPPVVYITRAERALSVLRVRRYSLSYFPSRLRHSTLFSLARARVIFTFLSRLYNSLLLYSAHLEIQRIPRLISPCFWRVSRSRILINALYLFIFLSSPCAARPLFGLSCRARLLPREPAFLTKLTGSRDTATACSNWLG